jgi:hypothetical protein
MSRAFFSLIALLSLFTTTARAGTPSRGSGAISGFHYTSCSKIECVELTAEKAFLSVLSGGFTTDGLTSLTTRELDGRQKSTILGTTASFNPGLGVLTFEKTNGGLVLYSLKDSRAQNFGSGVTP